MIHRSCCPGGNQDGGVATVRRGYWKNGSSLGLAPWFSACPSRRRLMLRGSRPFWFSCWKVIPSPRPVSANKLIQQGGQCPSSGTAPRQPSQETPLPDPNHSE